MYIIAIISRQCKIKLGKIKIFFILCFHAHCANKHLAVKSVMEKNQLYLIRIYFGGTENCKIISSQLFFFNKLLLLTTLEV